MASYFIDESEDGFGQVFVARGPWQPAYTDLVENHRIPVVRLSAAMGWHGTDLQFLRDLRNLRGVEIYSAGTQDLSVIDSLHHLQLLGLDCEARSSINFENLPELEVVKARWTWTIKGVLQSAGLKHLNLSNWPDDNLESLSSMTRLSKLQLTSRKLKSLGGLDSLQLIEWLDLHACPKLTSIEGLRTCESISHLEITSCKAVCDIAAIGALESLRVLCLDDNGDIESLEPIRRCKVLETLSFLGTTRILDGRISTIEELSHLRTLRFAPRRYYDRTRDEVLGKFET